MSETRSLYVYMLYNWKTRAKRFLENESEGPNSIGEFYETWTPADGEMLYLLSTDIEPVTENKVGALALTVHRADDKSRRPLYPGESALNYLGAHVLEKLKECLPPGCYGPEKGPLAAKFDRATATSVHYSLSIPGNAFSVTVREHRKEEAAEKTPCIPMEEAATGTWLDHPWNNRRL